jgi:hypothetical protein
MSELLKEKAEDAKSATIDTIDKREGILLLFVRRV